MLITFKKYKYISVAALLITVLMAMVFAGLGVFKGKAVYADEATDGVVATELADDTTLQSVVAFAKQGTTAFTLKTSGMPNDGETAVTSAYSVNLSNADAIVTANAIKFTAPIALKDVEESGGLTLRMYAHLSQTSPFYIKFAAQAEFFNGIYLYGLGMTGAASDTPVWVPSDIVQDEWIDFHINAFDASRLCVNGELKGLTLGMRIQGETDSQFYVGNQASGNSYIYISKITLEDSIEDEPDYGEIGTHLGMGNLTYTNGVAIAHDNAYVTNPERANPARYQASAHTPIHIKTSGLPEDGGAVSKAYSLTFHSWTAVTSLNSILFNRPLTLAEVQDSEGITLRMYASLTTGGATPYLTMHGGIRFYGYGKGIDGNTDDHGVLIPADVKQNEWIDFYISPENAERMVGDDGMMYGLQYGVRLAASNNTEFFIGEQQANAARLYISTITLRAPKPLGSGAISVENISYGEMPNPIATSTTNGTDVRYEYKAKNAKDTEYVPYIALNAGEYTVRAVFAANDDYRRLLLTADFTIAKVNQDKDVTLSSISDAKVGRRITLSATGGSRGAGDMKYVVVSGGAEISGDVLTVTGEGEIKVKAIRTGGTNFYDKESAEVTFTGLAGDAATDPTPNPTNPTKPGGCKSSMSASGMVFCMIGLVCAFVLIGRKKKGQI